MEKSQKIVVKTILNYELEHTAWKSFMLSTVRYSGFSLCSCDLPGQCIIHRTLRNRLKIPGVHWPCYNHNENNQFQNKLINDENLEFAY